MLVVRCSIPQVVAINPGSLPLAGPPSRLGVPNLLNIVFSSDGSALAGTLKPSHMVYCTFREGVRTPILLTPRKVDRLQLSSTGWIAWSTKGGRVHFWKAQDTIADDATVQIKDGDEVPQINALDLVDIGSLTLSHEGAMCFSPNGAHFATRSLKGLLEIWDLTIRPEEGFTKMCAVGQPEKQSPQTTFVSFNRDGSTLYYDEYAQRYDDSGVLTVCIAAWDWNLPSPTVRTVVSFRRHFYAGFKITYNVEKDIVAAWNGFDSLSVWSLQSGGMLWEKHPRSLPCFQFSPNGRTLAHATRSGTVMLRDSQSGDALWDTAKVYFPDGGPKSLALSNDRIAISGAGPNFLYVWDYDTPLDMHVDEEVDP